MEGLVAPSSAALAEHAIPIRINSLRLIATATLVQRSHRFIGSPVVCTLLHSVFRFADAILTYINSDECTGACLEGHCKLG